MEAYSDAIRKVADMFGADIIDFASCDITASNVPNYMTDGRIHPNKDGQALMGNKVIEEIAPFIATRYDILVPVVNNATPDNGDEGGAGGAGEDSGGDSGGDSGEEDTQTYIAQYDFTSGNSNDLVGTMNGADTEITYTAGGAVFGAKSLMAFGKYDMSNKKVEIDMGSVTGESGVLFCANIFDTFLGRGLKFENAWTYVGADSVTNTTERADVQAVANKTLKFVYGAASSGYIPVEMFFGDTSIISVARAAYTGGYLYLGTGGTTLPMTIRAMRILA